MKNSSIHNIEEYIASEIEEYEKKIDEAAAYSCNIDGYLDLLREVESNINDLRQYKEDILKFETKNKI